MCVTRQLCTMQGITDECTETSLHDVTPTSCDRNGGKKLEEKIDFLEKCIV